MNEKTFRIVESFDDIEIYKDNVQITQIGALAMQEEKEKNRKLGIPSCFMHEGQILYELPDGTITKESPWTD